MKDILVIEYHIPVRWLETEALTTTDSARFLANQLSHDNIHTIVLVTHAWHMPRAAKDFTRAGFTVIAAPTRFSQEPVTPIDYLPKGYEESRAAMHEWLGLARDAVKEAFAP